MSQAQNVLDALRNKLISDAEARWRTLASNTSNQIMFLDTEGTILYINHSLPMLDAKEALGGSIYDFVTEVDVARLHKAFEHVIDSGESHHLKLHHKTRDGQDHLFCFQVYPVKEEDEVVAFITETVDLSRQHQQKQTLEHNLYLLNSIIEHSPIIIWAFDDKGIFTLSEGNGLSKLGYQPGEVVGRSVFDVYKNYPQVLQDAEQALTGQEVKSLVTVKDYHFQTSYSPIFDEQQNLTSVIGVAHDVTPLSQMQEKMRIVQTALEQTTDVVLITNSNGIIEYVNPAFEAITGYSQQDAIGQNPRILKSGKQDLAFYQTMWETLLHGDNFSEVFVNRRKDGTLYYEEKTITPVRADGGNISHFISTGKDISERMRTQERLHYMAHHDALTKLPNRTLFLDRLRQAMARAQWHNRLIAIIFLDVDNFKDINDQFSHDVGDQLLIQLTKRLTNDIRSGDTVARFGGDEFVVLLDDIASEKDVSVLAKKILDALVAPFDIDSRELHVTGSIGVSIYPGDGDDPETLIRNADVAMYRAKHLGKNNYQFYSNEMSARAFERLTLENSLRHAVQRKEFYLLYHPQVDTQTGEITGVEALLRWEHPEMGTIAPADFVPLLEETGMIGTVGNWVLKEACKQAAQWHAKGHNLNISVNLSSRQFNNPEFIQSFDDILSTTGLKPELLELELTESMLMRNASKTISALNTLSHFGLKIAIDDFGTGYSSLNYLRRFPIDTLKIDRSFIRDVIEDADDAAIATAIIVMAQSLNLKVVAEGVETAEQLAFLKNLKCNTIQGNYFHDAMSAAQVTELLIDSASRSKT